MVKAYASKTFLCFALIAALCGGCARKDGPCEVVQVRPTTRYHEVRDGDTIASVAKLYGMTPDALCRLNSLTPQATLIPGQKVFIVPQQNAVREEVGRPVVSVSEEVPTDASVFEPVPGESDPNLFSPPSSGDDVSETLNSRHASDRSVFAWPVVGRLLRRFGDKLPNGGVSEGINIAAPAATDVRACADGLVMDAGELVLGFGQMILLRHDNGMISIYGHLQEIKVKRPQQGEEVTVQKGQVIARVGKTGNVRTPQLHFQLRNRERKPVNPLFYLDESALSPH